MTLEIDRLVKKIRNDDCIISRLATANNQESAISNDIVDNKQPTKSVLVDIPDKNTAMAQSLENLLKFNTSTKKISSIRITDEFVVNETIYAVVSAKRKYRDTLTLVLEDDTGQIMAHTNLDTFSVGDILELENCGLWKTASGNELNITSRNLKYVHTRVPRA